jgi:hypothetical protein
MIAMIFCFAGCKVKDDTANKLMDECGFVLIEKNGKYGDYHIYRVYDAETKVEYILTTGYSGTIGLCPRFDENGEVVIYKGE